MTESNETINDLKNYLNKEIRQHKRNSIIKNILAQFLFFLVIIISGLGLINAKTSWFNENEISILAVLPGIILIITNTFKFEARSKWNKMKQRTLEGLYWKLVYENVSVQEISKELRAELKRLDEIKVQLEKPITK